MSTRKQLGMFAILLLVILLVFIIFIRISIEVPAVQASEYIDAQQAIHSPVPETPPSWQAKVEIPELDVAVLDYNERLPHFYSVKRQPVEVPLDSPVELYIEEQEEEAVEEPPIEVEPELEIEPVEVYYTIPAQNETDLDYLACAIYKEGGSHYYPDEFRYRIGDMILNRVDSVHFPDNLYDVLTQKGQYNTFYWTGIVWPEEAYNNPDDVNNCYHIAADLLNGIHSDLYGGEDAKYVWQAEFEQGFDVISQCGNYFGKRVE